jgi:diguanylate cyclase (GGDEF)-like protein
LARAQPEVDLAEAERWERIGEVGSWRWNLEADTIHWSPQAQNILGSELASSADSSTHYIRFVHDGDVERVFKALERTRVEGTRFDLEHRLCGSDGHEVTVRMRGLPEGRRIYGTVQDVTEQALLFRRMRYLADHDTLTGLPNRRAFVERIEQCVQAARRNQHEMALLFIDLDGFKTVNDSLGHGAGDQLLAHVAERILGHIRSSDALARCGTPDKPAVSRLGGDEFALLLTKVDGAAGTEIVADRLASVLAEPILIDQHEVAVSGSIGISMFPADATTAEDLFTHADQAMYQAKSRGPNNYAFYDQSMDTASLRRLTVASRLRRAVARDEVHVHFQPRLDLRKGAVAGGEALARWKDETLGQVSPAEFIPIAESTGLIIPLGRRVLERACEQVRGWLDAGYEDFVISVNVSPQQFIRENVVAWVSETLQKYRTPPQYLELEITENLFLGKAESIGDVLRDLRSIGLRIALDDFGTGYSSLSYLLQFPIDTLKIDRCLLKNVPHNGDAAGVVKALIEMSASLGIRTVAEGVDDEAQADWLDEHGCDEIQGFLISGALESEGFLVTRARVSRIPMRCEGLHFSSAFATRF